MAQISVPPNTFNLGPAFRPDNGRNEVVEGLLDTVEKLTAEGRMRSAADLLFRALDAEPTNDYILRLTAIALGGSRTTHHEAIERLTDQYWSDPRLDPLYAVCSHCKKTSWIPKKYLMQDQYGIRSDGARANQCHHCGYVVCRNCHQGLADTCLNCGQPKPSHIVYPTGRSPRQTQRTTHPVVFVLILREGPIKPDKDYIQEILARACPQALEGNPQLLVVPAFPWPDDLAGELKAMIARQFPDGLSKDMAIIQLVDSDENRVCIATLTDALGSFGELSEKLRTHLLRTSLRHQSILGWEHCELVVQQLGDDRNITLICKAIEELSENAHENIATNVIAEGDIIVVVSNVPGRTIPHCQQQFGQGGYLEYFQSIAGQLGFGKGQSFVHLIYCSQMGEGVIHMTLLPGSTAGIPVLPIELMTDEEKMAMGV